MQHPLWWFRHSGYSLLVSVRYMHKRIYTIWSAAIVFVKCVKADHSEKQLTNPNNVVGGSERIESNVRDIKKKKHDRIIVSEVSNSPHLKKVLLALRNNVPLFLTNKERSTAVLEICIIFSNDCCCGFLRVHYRNFLTHSLPLGNRTDLILRFLEMFGLHFTLTKYW